MRLFLDLVTDPVSPPPSTATYHAEAIFQESRRELLRQAIDRSAQMYRETTDFMDLLTGLRQQWEHVLGLASEAAGFDIIEGLTTVPEFVRGTGRSQYEWVIPGMLERQERLFVVAPVKSGKSVLSRQVCLALALGKHPFWMDQAIDPMRTLLIDLENPTGIARRSLDRQQDYLGHLADESDAAWIWHRPSGIHLGDPADALALERAIDTTGADLVAICPLYKTFTSTSAQSWEYQANVVGDVLDRLREKYGCAFWIEHHSPKDDARGLVGSSRWERWYDHKIVLVPEDPTLPPPHAKLLVEATMREGRLCPVEIEQSRSGMGWVATFDGPFHALLAEANQV
jgi:replicative DNA helicase